MKTVVAAALFFSLLAVTSAPASTTEMPPSPTQHDISLADCLQIANEHNAQLRTASVQFQAADGQVISLHAILYPKLDAQALTTPTTFFAQVTQTVYSRAILPHLRLSQLSEDEALINYRQTFNDVMYQVRQAFISALGAQAQLDLSRAYADQQVAALTSAQQLFDAGQVQKNTILGIQVKADLARHTQSLYQLQVTQALLALENVLGQELPPSTRLVGNLLMEAPAQLDIPKLTASALQNRQDLKTLQTMQLAARQEIEIDLQSEYPSVSMGGNGAFQTPAFGPISGGSYDLERNENEPATQRQKGDSQVEAGFYLNWKIFDGGTTRGSKMSDTAQIASREVAIEQLRQSIGEEIVAAVATINIQRDTLRALEGQASPGELRQLAGLEFDAGRIRQLDKAYLEDDILQQQQQRLTAEYRLSQAAAALDHALGDGLETSVARPRP